MGTSIFLAQFLGMYSVIIGLVLLLKPKMFEKTVKEIAVSHYKMFMLALITLVPGIALVLVHNIWAWEWYLVITLFSWICLISGILRFVLHDKIMKIMKTKNIRIPLLVGAIISVILGLFLCYYGFDLIAYLPM
jgi:hypothetical protein